MSRAWAWFTVASILVACGGAAAPNAAPAAGQPAAIAYAFPDDTPTMTAADALIKAYSSLNPAVQIAAQPLPAKDYAQQLLTRLGSNAPDLFVSADTQVPALIKRNALLDLQPLLPSTKLKADDLLPRPLEAWRRGSALYGLPADVVPRVLFYNQNLFDANSLPYPTSGWTGATGSPALKSSPSAQTAK
jgi:ABC-type glycerol-3-phosphate transport system substrate-binding protein